MCQSGDSFRILQLFVQIELVLPILHLVALQGQVRHQVLNAAVNFSRLLRGLQLLVGGTFG